MHLGKAPLGAFVICALLLSCSAVLAAGPQNDPGFNKFVNFVQHWGNLAYKGDPKGELMFGLLLMGSTDPASQFEGRRWLTKSAGQGYAKAVSTLRSLAAKGDTGFQMLLGSMYADGTAVAQDYIEAARWYGLCAENGDAACQNELGVMYLHGRGVQRDYVQAHKWFNLAASGSVGTEVQAKLPQLAADLRNMAVNNRALVAAMMSSEQIAEAQRLAREWRMKHSMPHP